MHYLGIEIVNLAMLCQPSYSLTYQLSANLHAANEVGMDIWLMALEITSHISNLYNECSNLCLITKNLLSQYSVCDYLSQYTKAQRVNYNDF